MVEPIKDGFTYDLLDLPEGATVPLDDAIEFALYGGIPKIRFSAIVDPVNSEGWFPFVRTGIHFIRVARAGKEDEVLQGPDLVDLAKPGSIMFNLGSPRTPASVELAHPAENTPITAVANEREYSDTFPRGYLDPSPSYSGQLLNPVQSGETIVRTASERNIDDGEHSDTARWSGSRRSGNNGAQAPSEWDRRYAEFERAICKAAHRGALTFQGVPMAGPRADVSTDSRRELTSIGCGYFSVWRGLDEEGVHAVSAYDTDDLPAPLILNQYTSYGGVVVGREGLVAVLKQLCPALFSRRGQTAIARVADERRAAAELAIRIKSGTCGTRAQEAERLGFPSADSRSFNRIWSVAYEIAEIAAPVGRPKTSAP